MSAACPSARRSARSGGLSDVAKMTRRGLPPEFNQARKDASSLELRVGFFDHSKYTNGTPVAYIATIHEFGYPGGGIPARPFFRPTISAQGRNWSRQVAGAIVGALRGQVSLRQAYDQIGALAAGDVRKTIRDLVTPPLKAGTIAARQRKLKTVRANEHPLIDTGTMLQAVTWEVA